MIEATARILKNIIELKIGEEGWVARPVQAELGHRFAALFSTEYHLYRSDRPDVVESTISYRAKADEIRIQKGEESWRTQAKTFGPMTIEYGAVRYVLYERLTGKFALLDGERPVAVGQLGFRVCTLREYPPELGTFLGHLAVGYLIRSLTWQGLG